MYKMVSSLLLLMMGYAAHAQSPKSYSSSQIFENIKKLDVLGSVLYVAAHPDDENTRLLAYLANEKLYRTAYLSITRGDGGQNLIGDEQGVELGLIRTQELLAARRIDGAEQFFTRAYDFGYSKNPEETFSIWDKQKILSDVVWVIRKFQPDVIINRFPTTGEGGHGHHTASAILAEEAFDAAGDPSKFTEHFKHGVKPWKAKRLLWNSFNFGSTNTVKSDHFKIDAGGYNSLTGRSYGELSAESRSQHKSQGFGVPASRGMQLEAFSTIKGNTPAQSLMDGVPTDWSRINQPNIKTAIDKAVKEYSFQNPEKSLPALINIYRLINKSGDTYWRTQKLKEVAEVIRQCSGLFLEATSVNMYAIKGDSLRVNFTANNRIGNNVSVLKIKGFNREITVNEDLKLNDNVRRTFSLMIPGEGYGSQPYWLTDPMLKGSFNVSSQEMIGKAWNDPQSMEVIIKIHGEQISYTIPLQYKTNDPVKGEEYQPLFILPALEIQSAPSLALSVNGKEEHVVPTVKQNAAFIDTFSIEADHPAHVIKTPAETGNNFSINNGDKEGLINFTAKSNGEFFDSHRKMITYDHIPSILYFQKAHTRIVSVDLQVAGKRAGYIPGAGDRIPEALTKMGYDVTMLSQSDITRDNLQKFDAIITGVRAYNIHEWLNDSYQVLMDYVEAGGVLMVQYNTNNNIGPVKAKIGPYPFSISRTRITDENAHVTFTDKDNLLINYPNKLAPKDFMNWIQERSTYHAANFENNYKTLFSMADAGEKEEEGSLIYTDYGKGRFIYTGLVFFRELPAGVPGAYRIFANLIAVPRGE